jgi:hypothetical protein
MENALDRAQRDIEEGRLWKARDRLIGRLRALPTDRPTLDMLGDVYWRMGDLPKAGAVWALTDRTDSDARAAFDATRERHGHDPEQLLGALHIRAPLDDYGSEVALRLRALDKDSRFEDRLAERLHARSKAGGNAPKSSIAGRLGSYSCGCIFVAFVILMLAAVLIGLAVMGQAAATATDGLSVPLVGGVLGLLIAGGVMVSIAASGLETVAERRKARLEATALATTPPAVADIPPVQTEALNADNAFRWGLFSIVFPPVGPVGIWYGRDALRLIRLSGGALQGERKARLGLRLGVIGTVELALLFFLISLVPTK